MRTLAPLLCALVALAQSGCGEHAIERGAPPLYSEVSRRLEQDLLLTDRLWARATVEVRYTDDDGERRFEQGEGRLRLEAPAHVALSAGKIGETLFWLGSDDQRYWWFDLTGDERTGVVGRHDGPGRGRGGLAATVNPRDLARLMGLVPPAAEPAGAMQWSADGRLLGITSKASPALGGGFERRWVDPDSLRAAKIEIYDPARRLVLVADLGDYESMRITGSGTPGPAVPTRVAIGHPESGSEIRLYLSDVEDGAARPDAGAFEFDRLVTALKAQRVIDLDEPLKPGY